MRKRILSMGEAVVDVLPAEGGLWRPVAGGSSYNVALALARQGAPVAFVGRLSRDEQGELMAEALRREGVDVDLLARDDRPSPLSLVSRGSETGHARYSIYLAGTAHAPPDLPASWLDGAAHLHVSSFSAIAGEWGAAVEQALAAARGAISASFDINIRAGLIPPRSEARTLIERRLALVGIVKASDEDLAWLAPEKAPAAAAAEWSERFGCLVLLTQGAAGATAFANGRPVHRPGRRVAVKDTVGAGDAFVAAFLARVMESDALGAFLATPETTLGRWLDAANAAAALCCGRAGADGPTRAETEAFLHSS